MIFTLNDIIYFQNLFYLQSGLNWHHYKAYHETSYLLKQFQSQDSHSECSRPSAVKI